MATKLANNGGPNPHTSGIFSDMTVDGPEIGTLVLIVDRAKNLPNRKTMGKQNPYCAGRLGKEAKKTETDKRGGQTPRWDQEMRFTVHDSPDYHNLKISVFSEDKRTDLVGEAWVNLKEVVVPGGGKADLWQGLNYKGKYAGELRIELTYYDERPRPDQTESVAGMEELMRGGSSGSSRVKRRPLPGNTGSRHVTPDTIPDVAGPGRAKHGPRDLRMPPRANSMPPESYESFQARPQYAGPQFQQSPGHGSMPTTRMQSANFDQLYAEDGHYQASRRYEEPPCDLEQLPDLLPQLPPSNRQRSAFVPPQQQPLMQRDFQLQQHRPHSHLGLVHSHSAPVVPLLQQEPLQHDDGYQLRTNFPDPIPDLDYQHQQLAIRPRRSDIQQQWLHDNREPFEIEPQYEEEENCAPPPPPVHSISAPVVPQCLPTRTLPALSPLSAHAGTPPNMRHYSVPNSSPLPSIERQYGTLQRPSPQGLHARGMSVDSYTSGPELFIQDTPPSLVPGKAPSPYSRPQQTARPSAHRLSIAESYTTPPRPHPLSQEVPRSRSPLPATPQGLAGTSPQSLGHSPYQQGFRDREAAPLFKPRAISPGASQSSPQLAVDTRPRSAYEIQHPVRAQESADHSPLSTSRPNARLPPNSYHSTPARKSVSSQPTTPTSAGATPFSPDSFDIHNPNVKATTISNAASPHSPYQIRPGSEAHPRNEQSGPIVGFHGQQVDPSDHLPVDSWAPEPEVKTPTKSYGQGRDRDFGPRSAQASPASGSKNLSKDTIINFRARSQTESQPQSAPSTFRNRLRKKSGVHVSSPVEPLQELHNYNSTTVPNPYTQQEFSRGFYTQRKSGNGSPYESYPSSPADALSHEISSIDIGGSRHQRSGSVPAPTAYVPVRSHRDRSTFY